MEISYQLFEKENLLIQKYKGAFCIEEYIRYNRLIMSCFDLNSIKKVLIDFRDLKINDFGKRAPNDFNEVIDKITAIRKDINNNELKDKEVVLVLWVDKPLPTVIAHLFVKGFDDKNYNYCSTVKNIIGILGLPEHFRNLETIVANLENTFNPG
jgi:hypothetical protein